MSKTLHTLNLERNILNHLEKTPCSISSISDDLGIQYYTARRIVNDLYERGLIKVVQTIDRHKVYGFNLDSDVEHEFIPRILDSINKNSVKAIYMLEAVGHEQSMKSTQAACRLPKHVVDLMITANFAAHGQDVSFRLDRIREALQKDYLYLKNAASIYEQLLKEPRFWATKALAEMTDDADYNYQVVQQAYDFLEQRSGNDSQ